MRTLGRLGRACYGHGVWGLLPHHAVTLPLPSGEPVPSDGIVPSKNLCHLFKERILRVSRGVQTPSGERSVRRLDGADDGGLGHAHAQKIAAERDCGGRSARPGH